MIGLQGPYNDEESVKVFICKILALRFLPHEHIIPAFNIISNEVSHQPTLNELCDYVKDTWIEGNWSPEDWSVFNRYIRTNNDTEGWHRRINTKAQRQGLTFYKLVKFLWKESKAVSVQITLTKLSKMSRLQRNQYKNLDKSLFNIWGKYMRGEITTSELLRKAARHSAPSN